jgi:DNA-directed RNA polymerase subunit RPC12/RpoP
MRIRTNTRCLKCRAKFEVDEGGDATSHLLRCEECGQTTTIEFDRLGWLYLRYSKWLVQGFDATTSEHICDLQALPCTPMPQREYERRVEAIAGSCECGGDFTFDASPRCPECRSEDIAEGWEVA